MNANQAVSDTLQKFLSDTFFIEFGKNIGPRTDLFEAGLIDSFGFVELVTFIERTYGVALHDDDFESPEISNLAGLQKIIMDRLGTAAQ